jgi:hypothetical protein
MNTTVSNAKKPTGFHSVSKKSHKTAALGIAVFAGAAKIGANGTVKSAKDAPTAFHCRAKTADLKTPITQTYFKSPP